MKLGDKVRIMDSLFYHGGYIVCLDPLTVLVHDGEEIPIRNPDSIEIWEPKKFITSTGKHNKGQRQLSNERENTWNL